MSETPRREPDQRSVMDQLRLVVVLANRYGHYDAADWIQRRLADLRTGQPDTSVGGPTESERLEITGGILACPDCEGGLLFHLYNDEGDELWGMICHQCDYTLDVAGRARRQPGTGSVDRERETWADLPLDEIRHGPPCSSGDCGECAACVRAGPRP